MEKIINNEYLIRPFEESDMPEFKELLRTSWNENHIFFKSEELLRWQYNGCGKQSGMHFPVLFNRDGRMIGFRGAYPAEINIPYNNKVVTSSIAIGALYLVIPEYRGKKLGLALQQFTQEYYGNYMAIGSNLGTSAPIYRKSNYLMLEQMHRYVTFLNMDAKVLCLSNYTPYLTDKKSNYNKAEAVDISPKEMEVIWKESPCSEMLSINKSEDYWNWRYYKHPIYKYVFFGGKDNGGVIVGRICNLYKDKNRQIDPTIFRIIEIIPDHNSFCSSKLSELMIGVINWARLKGCCMIETYMTTNIFSNLLVNCGFRLLSAEESKMIVSNYEPMSESHKLTNVSIYIGCENDCKSFDTIYLSIADSDQDRPNLIM